MIGNKSFYFIFWEGGGGFPKLVYTFKSKTKMEAQNIFTS